MSKKIFPSISLWILSIAVVIAGSYFAVELRSSPSEEKIEVKDITVTSSMNAKEIREKNGIENGLVILKALGIDKSQGEQTLNELNIDPKTAKKKITKAIAVSMEAASKDWLRIRIKFALWFVYLAVMFILIRSKKISKRMRMIFYGVAVVLFGVVLGSDPSPLGTVKDAVVLFGEYRVLFKPRLIAFTGFIATVIIANKFICAWGCQLGTFQDFLFRLLRNEKDSASKVRTLKVPFVISNSIRAALFVAMIIASFLFGMDIIGGIDLFKIFHPQALAAAAIVFGIIVAVAALFVYRPFCHFVCPFGFVGWMAEHISVFRIRVNYSKCTDCRVCEKACPTNVMGAILDKKAVKPDCFSCGVCIANCPTDSIHFGVKSKGKSS